MYEISELVLIKYNVKIQNLPKINREDPIVKFIGGRPNQIIKIDNFNPTTGLSINYRFVVKSLINSYLKLHHLFLRCNLINS